MCARSDSIKICQTLHLRQYIDEKEGFIFHKSVIADKPLKQDREKSR